MVDFDKSQAQGIMARYQADPIRFMVDCLDVKQEFVWSKMREVCESVRDNQLTAVKAGHSVSKSYTAARLALWFLYCYYPATVITTAPTHKQVEDVLWREIREAHTQAKIPLGGECISTELDLGEKWFATGFSTRPDTATQQATKFQGFHNKHVLVIFDEAAGILPQIWIAAMLGLITTDNCKLLAIGNPTSGYGDFVDCFKPDSKFNKITIAVQDTPNYIEGKEVIPGVSGRAYEQRIRKQYGETSSFYLSRVKGEIPEVVEGAVFAREMIKARQDKRICSLPAEPHALVHTAWDLGAANTAIWFFRIVGQEIHIVDYFQQLGPGLGFADYVQIFDDKRRENEWVYGRHFAPHDIEQHEMATGNTRLQAAREVGINFIVLPKLSVADGIEAARLVLPRCWFNEATCEQGLKGLCEYQWKRIESLSRDGKPAYGAKPKSDWASHPADGFRYLAIAYQQGLVKAQSPSNESSHAEWAGYYGQAG